MDTETECAGLRFTSLVLESVLVSIFRPNGVDLVDFRDFRDFRRLV